MHNYISSSIKETSWKSLEGSTMSLTASIGACREAWGIKMYEEGGYIDMNVRGGSGEETASLETVQFRDAQTFKRGENLIVFK